MSKPEPPETSPLKGIQELETLVGEAASKEGAGALEKLRRLAATKPSDDFVSPQLSNDPVKRFHDESRTRQLFAVLLAVIGIASILVAFYFAHESIDRLLARQGSTTLTIVAMATHAVITVAAVYFAYQMLKAAERLLIPRHLYTDVKEGNVEIIRALTGLESPTEAASKAIKGAGIDPVGLMKASGEVVKTTGDALKTAIDAAKKP